MLLRTHRHRLLSLLCCATVACTAAVAQTTAGWLRYAVPPDPPRYHGLPHTVVLLGSGTGQAAPEELAAADELDHGLGHMVAGTDMVMHRFDGRIDSIVLGTTEALHRARIGRLLPGWTEKPLPEEGFRIVHLRRGIREWYILQGGSPRAELWAAFRFAALVAEDQQLPEDFSDAPRLPLRATDLGDATSALPLLESPGQSPALPRLLASVGMNGVIISGNFADTARVARALRPYGMRVWLRTDDAADQFRYLLNDLMRSIPDLGGLVVASDFFGNSLDNLRYTARLANLYAKALRHTGGSVMLEDALGAPLLHPGTAQATPEECAALLRGTLEPNILLTGAAADTEQPLPGAGSANFGLLPGQPQLAAFRIVDNRLDGLAYPVPSWSGVLATPERGLHGDTTLATLLGSVAGYGGVVGTLPSASAQRMLGQPLLHAYLYAFGRLAWSPELKPAAVAEEWSRQTWGDDARAFAVASGILLRSASAAVNQRAPLGLPLLTQEVDEMAAADGTLATSSDTSGPDPEQLAGNALRGIPLASAEAIGMDRGSRGTNEIARYPARFAAELADVTRCPEPWLLLFHRLPFTALLPGGKTVVQSLYDAHFAGAAEAANALDAWEGTLGLVDEPRYRTVHAFLAGAATHAEIWRERMTEWELRTSGVPDALGFVGSHPGRVEAEVMQLAGYTTVQTGPRRSGGAEIVCGRAECTASTRFDGEENVYRIEIAYEEVSHGIKAAGDSFDLLVNGEMRARWTTAAGTRRAAGQERFVVNGVRLRKGDAVAIRAVPGGVGKAPLDFLEISRDPRWN